MSEAPLLSEAELRRLDRLRIRRRRPVRAHAPGEERVGRLGSGILFADHRDYVPGDDLRSVDWHVYARLGELVVKQYEVEENLELLLCVDRSRSMEGRRSLAARRLAAALGYVALARFDRVRLAFLPVAPSVPVTVHSGKGRARALLGALADAPLEGATAHARDVVRVLAAARRRAVAVVVSDFYDPENAVAGLAALRAHGHDVVAVHVLDRDDVDLPVGQALRAVDRETGAEVRVDVTPAFLESLRATWHRRAESLERWCVAHQVLYQRLDAHAALWDALGEMLGRGVAVGSRR